MAFCPNWFEADCYNLTAELTRSLEATYQERWDIWRWALGGQIALYGPQQLCLRYRQWLKRLRTIGF